MSMDIEKICRTCLALSGPLLSIYDNSSSTESGGGLVDMLSSFTKNRPRREDNLPEKVCLSCISEINRCYSFKLKCENSSRTLRQLLPDAAVLDETDEKPKAKQIHKSSQTGATQTVNVEVQTAALEENKPPPAEKTDMATSPLVLMPLPRDNKAQLHKKLKLEQEMPEEELSIVEELEENVEEQEEYIIDKLEAPTITRKRKRNIRLETNEELILEVHDLPEADVVNAVVLQENEDVEENASDVNDETYYEISEQHFVYDEAEGEMTPKETPQRRYYVQEEQPQADDELEEVINEVEEHDEYEQFLENPTEEEERVAEARNNAAAAETAAPASKNTDYNFTIYNNVYGEEAIRPKRQRNKRDAVTTSGTGERMAHKCPECVMTFVSKKTLARHMFKRHNWSLKQAESMKVEEVPSMALTPTQEDDDDEQPLMALDSEEVEQVEEERDQEHSEALLSVPHEMQASLLQQLREEIELDKKDTATDNTTQRLSTNIIDNDAPTEPPTAPIGEFPYSCIRCKAGFAARKSLNFHRKLNICSTRSYECNECNRVFVSQQNLDEHKAQHVLSNICNECNGVYETAQELSVHMVLEHNRKMRHQCGICKKVFTMLSALKDHERVHSGEKPYLCTTCGKAFSQNANLKQHVMRHSKEKKFKCEHCSNSYVTKAELYSHTRTHTGDHPYQCEYCETTFTSQSSLTKHKRKHTGERPYACDICPMRFTALNVLKNHRRTHTGERPFKCPYCKKAFTQKGDCMIHQRTHTGNRRVRNRNTTSAAAASKENEDDQMHITIVNVDDETTMEETQNSAETCDEELIQITMEDMC